MEKIKNIKSTGFPSSHPIPHTSYLLLIALLISANLFGQPQAGQKAPDIALRDVNGSVKTLSSFADKVVLVDFWASWCQPCRRANPSLLRLYEKYKPKGFEIYSVSIDEDKSAWKKAIAKDKISWTQVIESKSWDGPVASAWKIEQLPTSYLLDRSGKIVALDPSGKELERKIIKALKN